MTMVLWATTNQEEVISKSEVLTHRNLIQGSSLRGNRAMDWERPKINRNSRGVNQAERRESLIPYPERSCKALQQSKDIRDDIFTLQEVSRGHSILCRNNTGEGLNLLI